MDLSEIIPVGLADDVFETVEEQHTAAHIGSGSLRVLATPAMIGMMERTSHQLIARRLPEGMSSVGIHVDVRHLAATPVGARVRILSRVKAVEGRRIRLDVEVWDDVEKVGEGSHERAVVEIGRFLKRVEEKAHAFR